MRKLLEDLEHVEVIVHSIVDRNRWEESRFSDEVAIVFWKYGGELALKQL